jgi:hypothetical protein
MGGLCAASTHDVETTFPCSAGTYSKPNQLECLSSMIALEMFELLFDLEFPTDWNKYSYPLCSHWSQCPQFIDISATPDERAPELGQNLRPLVARDGEGAMEQGKAKEHLASS